MLNQGSCRAGAVILFIFLASASPSIFAQTSVNIDIQTGNANAYPDVNPLGWAPMIWNHLTGVGLVGLRGSRGQATGW